MGMNKLRRLLLDETNDAAQRYALLGRVELSSGFVPELTSILRALWQDSITKSGSEVVNKFKSDGFAHLETKNAELALYDRLLSEYFEKHGAQKISRISRTTETQVRKLVDLAARGQIAQSDIPFFIATRAPQIALLRAQIIADTEVHGATQFASQRAAEESRVPLEKTWRTRHDERVRDFGEGDGKPDAFNHRAMNGVTIPLHDAYQVPMKAGGTESLYFPGDPYGSAGNIISCRCSQTYERVLQ